MTWTRNVWNNFKTQPEIWFFYGFLLTSPFSIRKVFFDYPVLAEFNEYSGIYLYLSDIFLGLVLGSWLLSILYNKLYNSSNYSSRLVSPQKESSTPIQMFPVEHSTGQAWNFLRGRRGTRIVLLGLPALLVLWSFITILWSSQAEIAAYRSFKLFEFYLLYLFLALNPRCSAMVNIFHPSTNVPPQKECSTRNILRGRRGTLYGANMEHLKKLVPHFLRNFFRLIILIGVINAIIGILQVILQHSVGLFWLKESLIDPELPGVAKIILNGSKYMRAYGLFQHPNILGGFLFLSITLTLAYRQLFHPSQNVPPARNATHIVAGERGTSDGADVEHPTGQARNKFSYAGRYIITVALIIQIVAGILTFSKSAIFAFILALAYIFWHGKGKMLHPSTNVPPQKECSTRNILRGRRGTLYGAGAEHFGFLGDETLKKALLIAVTMGIGIYLIHPDFGSIFIKSMVERLVYIKISLNMISGNFLAGIGLGQFILEMQKYSSQVLLPWQFQPVHNVFLLIWSELGLIGLSLFGWLNWKLFHPSTNVPRGTFAGASVKHEPLELDTKNVSRGTTGFQIDISTVLKALLMGFFVIALFDHYLWDIQQGQIMLWITLGLLVRVRLNT